MVSEAQKKAVRKWEKENSYKIYIQLYNSKFPKEDYDKVRAKLKEMGMSKNEFIYLKFKELLGDE